MLKSTVESNNRIVLCFMRYCSARTFLWIVLFFPFRNLNAQDKYSFEIDGSIIANADLATINALGVFNNYLLYKENRDSLKKYWSKEEIGFFGPDWVDARYRYLDYSPSRNIHKFYKPFVLGIEKESEDRFIINLLYYHYSNDLTKLIVPYVYKIYVVCEEKRYVLQSALYYNIKRVEFKAFDNITGYKFGNIQTYTLNNLDTLNRINNYIANLYGCPPIKVKVILAESAKILMQSVGYNYERTMYYMNQSNAFSEPVNKLVFIAGLEENFVHELCHLYTHNIYSPNLSDATYHNFIDEGISTFLGGSLGIPLKKHLKKIFDYDKIHPIDFTNLASLRGGIDNITFYNCCIGGLLCEIVYEKKGMQDVLRLLKGGRTDESLYKTIESTIGIKREKLNKFIHEQLKKYAE